MTAYRLYTDDEIAAANNTDLPELLEHLGYTVKCVGRFYTTREMDSLRIWDRRSWYRYSESIGGDAIRFMEHFCGMSFTDAVRYLLNFNGYHDDLFAPTSRPRPRQAKPPPWQERRPFILPPPNRDNEQVHAYLLGRGIAPNVIDSFIDMGLLYEDTPYHNCVFIGRDSAETPAFATRRSTCGSFKGDAAGSSKKIGFHLPCDPALDTVHVFESPIDLMSWLTLYALPISNALALCGLWDGPLETYLRENPHIRRIVLCLDADGPGRKAAVKLRTKYQALGYGAETHFPPSGKDWNAYLQIWLGIPDTDTG